MPVTYSDENVAYSRATVTYNGLSTLAKRLNNKLIITDISDIHDDIEMKNNSNELFIPTLDDELMTKETIDTALITHEVIPTSPNSKSLENELIHTSVKSDDKKSMETDTDLIDYKFTDSDSTF